MTAVLPVGYVTILEAAEMLQPAMYAGAPDLPIVTELRQEGIEVNDGPAVDRTISELWKAVDKGAIRSMAIGGRPRQVVRLDAQFTKGVPPCAIPGAEDSHCCGSPTLPFTNWPHGLDRYFTRLLWRFG
jgi:hypothetical protein